MERPPHTNRVAIRKYLEDLRDGSYALAAQSSDASEPMSPAESNLATCMMEMATVISAFISAFTDIWAHQCAAFDALEIRINELEARLDRGTQR